MTTSDTQPDAAPSGEQASNGTVSPRRALIVVDIQRDFCEGGSLAVAGGSAVAADVCRLVQNTARSQISSESSEPQSTVHGEFNAGAPADSVSNAVRYHAIVATQDWHIDPGSHWSDEPDFVDSWPIHCRAESSGADLHPSLVPCVNEFSAIFRKGQFAAAYSGFEGVLADPKSSERDQQERPADASETHSSAMAEWLRARAITDVDVVGIATDHCVRATALDAAAAGFGSRVLLNFTAGVAESSTAAALDEMRAAGIELVGKPRLASA